MHVTPINTGSATRRPALRSPASFVPVERWAVDRWSSETAATGRNPRISTAPPVEIAIRDALPDLDAVVVDALDIDDWHALLRRSARTPARIATTTVRVT